MTEFVLEYSPIIALVLGLGGLLLALVGLGGAFHRDFIKNDARAKRITDLEKELTIANQTILRLSENQRKD